MATVGPSLRQKAFGNCLSPVRFFFFLGGHRFLDGTFPFSFSAFPPGTGRVLRGDFPVFWQTRRIFPIRVRYPPLSLTERYDRALTVASFEGAGVFRRLPPPFTGAGRACVSAGGTIVDFFLSAALFPIFRNLTLFPAQGRRLLFLAGP